MTLTEAIQILSLCKECSFDGPTDALEEAHQLGFQALRRIQAQRLFKHRVILDPLPSETKEQT